MAMISAAQLLDELMGRDRNLAPNDKRKELHWEDNEQVCKYFLTGFCPNELFINTRADLGPCTKLHDESLKKEYEKSSRFKRMGYEDDFLRFLQSMQADVERRIRRGKQRLSLNSSQGDLNSPNPSKNEEKISLLTDKIIALLEQVERLGCEGKVEEAQGMMKLCEKLKDERDNLQQTAEIAAAQEKQMEVCEVCGAFLIVGDAQQRVDDHLMGRQHVGYAKIRSTIEEIVNKRQQERDDRDRERHMEREERRKVRDEEDRQKDRDRDDRRKRRDDDYDRDKRKRSRSRSRDRRRKSRSKSREKKNPHLHGHDRSKRRSRSRSRPSHSQDKKRSHSSDKNKDKSKSRDKDRNKEKKDTKKEEIPEKIETEKEETETETSREIPNEEPQGLQSEGDTHSEP